MEINVNMTRIRKIERNNQEIFIVDYSDLKQNEMIEQLVQLRARVIKENKQVSIISIFNDKAFATAAFMREAEHHTRQTSHLVVKQALVGLNQPKLMILKGYNHLFDKDVKAFDSTEEAIAHLLKA